MAYARGVTPAPRRILLSTFGTAGDLLPFANLAAALARRGHAVTFHSWAHARGWCPAGAAFVAAGGDVTAAEVASNFTWSLGAASFVEQVGRFARLFYGLGDGPGRARAYFEGACEAFAGHDLAVINVLDHVGQAAAERLGLPWICFASRPPPDPAQADPFYAPLDHALGELLSSVVGAPRRVRMFRQHAPRGTLAACSPRLATPGPVPGVVLTGAWRAAPDDASLPPEVEAFLAAGPALLATFGTMPDLHGRSAALIAAAEAAGWRAILQVLSPPPRPLPSSEAILVTEARLPFAALLPRVAAVVHHGGAGTLHEVLCAGRPSLAIPHMADQFYWAACAHERGLTPPPIRGAALEPAALAAGLRALRDPRHAPRLAALAPALRAEDGVAAAVAAIEAQS